MNLLFLDRVPENQSAFENRLIQIAAGLGINPNWLMLVFYLETGGSMNHRTTNGIGATGLIQFLPATIAEYGITTDQLRSMSNVEQLDYIELYYSRFSGQIRNFIDCYLVTFFPLAVVESDDFVLQTNGLTVLQIAQANPGFDMDKNGQITISEIKDYFYDYILKVVPAEYHSQFIKTTMEKIITWSFVVLCIGLAIYLSFQGIKKM